MQVRERLGNFPEFLGNLGGLGRAWHLSSGPVISYLSLLLTDTTSFLPPPLMLMRNICEQGYAHLQSPTYGRCTQSMKLTPSKKARAFVPRHMACNAAQWVHCFYQPVGRWTVPETR